MKPRERNAKIVEMMDDFFEKASNGEYTIEESFQEDLELLFSTHVWGFREVIITVVMGRFINPQFSASTSFYSCSPRAIFEKPIRNTLLRYNIPNRKSGPLNVAKAIEGINDTWAAKRDCPEVAQAVVRLVQLIESFNEEELENFAIASC